MSTKPESAAVQLSQRLPVDADLVCGVPDSGLASQKAIPKNPAFRSVLRSTKQLCRPYLHQADQKERESSVKIKLSVLESVVKGKRIVLVDDSIVRGTTISNLITMLRKAGATEVHVRISSPPFLYPCYFGTDVPSNKQLIASSHSTEEIRQQIGADSLGYMPIEKLQNMVGDLPICRACFDSHYPMEVPKQDISALLES